MTNDNLSTINDLIDAYFESRDFSRVEASQKQYRYWLQVLVSTEIDGTQVGDLLYRDIRAPFAQRIYDTISDRGVTFANRIIAVIRKVYSFAIKYGYLDHNNPWSSVQTIAVPPRKVSWKPEYVKAFLDEAYSKFSTRSLGLIAHMSYEWAQRIGDMRLLQWDSIDFENRVLHLEQSKRRAVVHLPISDELFSMLEEQNGAFDFQPYVAPNTNTKEFKPYHVEVISRSAKRMIQKLGLPDELRLSDLRRTATTEMIEAGVGLAQIMQVTGHQNPQSVKPYMKNTLTGASNAIKLRNAHTAGGTSNV